MVTYIKKNYLEYDFDNIFLRSLKLMRSFLNIFFIFCNELSSNLIFHEAALWMLFINLNIMNNRMKIFYIIIIIIIFKEWLRNLIE